MIFRLAMGAAVCFALMTGSALAVTDAASTPAPEPAGASSDENATDTTNAAPEQDDSNPYSSIVRANVFHLQEPPKPVEKPNEALLNLPKVNITGFRKREGEPLRALFATVPKDPKESPKYFNLAEGEKEDILELKKIDPDQESVEVIIAGTPTTLTVKSNSFVQPVIVPKGGPVGVSNPGYVARPPTVAVPQQQVNPANYGQGAPYNPENSGGVIVAGGGVTPAAPSPGVGAAAPQPAYGAGFPPHPGNIPGVNGAPVSTGGESTLRSIPTRTPRAPGNYQGQ